LYSATAFWLVAVASLITGITAGWLMRRALDPAEQRARELERRLAEADAALQDYRREVTRHFRGTADRVNRLTEDYRELHAHLAGGAMELCDGSIEGEQVPLLTSLSGSRASAPVTTQPPLDYAPQRGAADVGSEDLDLERMHGA
jgi:hypothetical protein